MLMLEVWPLIVFQWGLYHSGKFIFQLLKKNPGERLGGGPDDSEPIKVNIVPSKCAEI